LVRNLAGKLFMTMSISLAPPSPGDDGAFTLAAWNIYCRRNAGLTSVAKGLVQMGAGLAILPETNLTGDRRHCLALGYKILATEETSHNQGGIVLLWHENHAGYEVESARITMPNLLTFQLVTGDKGFYCTGIYTLLV
jgi:DNA-binding transcriptional LysR family regulator